MVQITLPDPEEFINDNGEPAYYSNCNNMHLTHHDPGNPVHHEGFCIAIKGHDTYIYIIGVFVLHVVVYISPGRVEQIHVPGRAQIIDFRQITQDVDDDDNRPRVLVQFGSLDFTFRDFHGTAFRIVFFVEASMLHLPGYDALINVEGPTVVYKEMFVVNPTADEVPRGRNPISIPSPGGLDFEVRFRQDVFNVRDELITGHVYYPADSPLVLGNPSCVLHIKRSKTIVGEGIQQTTVVSSINLFEAGVGCDFRDLEGELRRVRFPLGIERFHTYIKGIT